MQSYRISIYKDGEVILDTEAEKFVLVFMDIDGNQYLRNRNIGLWETVGALAWASQAVLRVAETGEAEPLIDEAGPQDNGPFSPPSAS